MVGNILGSRYEVLERIGTGGMSLVYRARDITLNRLVAVKVLKHQWAEDEEVVRRFEQEARAAASLVDRHIVQVYDVGRDNPDIHYMIMELVAGETLRSKLDREGPLDPKTAIDIADQVAAGLEKAHARKLVHRDIKPQNVLITPEGDVKVADFGIAYAATTGTLVNTGSLLGTVQYLSPEQARGKLIGPQSDVYSLGVVLFEMLTGKLPFESDSPIGVAIKHLQDEPPRVDRMRAEVPKEVADIVERSLSKDPAERYQSARALRQDIARYLNPEVSTDQKNLPEALPGRRTNRNDQTVKERKRRRWWPWVILALVVLLLAGGSVYAFNRWIHVPTESVPHLKGDSLARARAILLDHHLHALVKGHGPSKSIPKNHVLKERPAPGSSVKSGQAVVLILSSGPSLVHVPTLRREQITMAEQLLTVLGLQYKTHTIASSLPSGEVARQRPKGGRVVGQGSTVTLWVSNGALQSHGTMPNLIDLTVSQAAAELSPDNVTMGTPSTQYSTQPRHTIIDQSPAPYTSLSGVTSASITVSEGVSPQSQSLLRNRSKILFTVPKNAAPKSLLKIVVVDQADNEEVYYQQVNPGQSVEWVVHWYGTSGSATISLNGQTTSSSPYHLHSQTSKSPSPTPTSSSSPPSATPPSNSPSSASSGGG